MVWSAALGLTRQASALASWRPTPIQLLRQPPPPLRARRWHSCAKSSAVAERSEVLVDPGTLSAGLDEHVASETQEVELPKASHTKVRTAEYVGSATKLVSCPKPRLPEFAVIGRSNVGKSSLINMLTGRESLAKTSKTPGKTQCINHFIINNTWYLVDLPGYGYAKRAKTSRLEWNTFTKQYFLERETLAMVLLLIDASIPPQAIDVECAVWLAESEVPFTLVFTKTDKRKKKVPAAAVNIKAFCDRLLEEFQDLPLVIKTSAVKATGRLELLGFIAQMRAHAEQQAKGG
ncbi:hypothetical protein WJX74_001986 [Apatococcus lobatus]|uniref:EngB-type G domain-containing protein n=1 Tax=Apatococcus lobatus TaxID=904363 RepID=A0AAW1QZX9_9CHLO